MRDGCKELSFYSHSVHIRIEGFRTDKLLDKAFRSGIALKDVRILSETEIEARIAGNELKRLKKTAGALYRITPIAESGIRPKLRVLAKRPLFCVGIALTAAIILLKASFISTVVVDGYLAIPEQSLRQCLAESGIYEGAYRASINWDKARSSLFKTFPQITWVKLVYDGTVVYLDISEAESLITDEDSAGVADKANDSGAYEDGSAGGGAEGMDATVGSSSGITYTNLVAAKSGYIESINPLWGEAQVEAGDYVKKGQVLITGCIPIEPTSFDENDPKEYYVKAQGEAWARVPYRLNLAQERYITAAEEKIIRENAQENKENDDETAESDEAEKTEGMGENVIVNKRERSTEEIKAKAEQQIRLWAKENLPENAEILNKSLNFTPKENIIEIGVTLEVRREISEEQEIMLGQENSDNRGN